MIKKILHVIGLPLLLIVSQFFITLIMTFTFLMLNNRPDLESWVGTEDYVQSLAKFFSDHSMIWAIVLFVIFAFLFIRIYNKEVTREKKKVSILTYFFWIMLGLSFSLLYNSILGLINTITPVTDLFDTNANLVVSIISTSIFGPILEEYLFRGIVYNRLQKYVSVMKAILITGLLFAFCHHGIFQIAYAFLFHFMLIFVYEKYDIKASVIVHMSANLTSILFCLFIYHHFFLTELSIVIAAILLIGSYIALKNEKNLSCKDKKNVLQ